MKKKLIAMLAAASAAAVAFAIAGCNVKEPEEGGKNHTHTFTDYVPDGNATCTEDGTKTAHCSFDGCTETDTVADTDSKLGHSFVNYAANGDATCTEDGTKTATCERNGCTETDTVADTDSKLGHSFVNYVANGDATCTEDGTKTATCEHDGCTEKDTVADNGSAGHNFKNGVCLKCGDKQKDTEGLTFELNTAGTGYILAGKGSATDTDIIIPAEYEGKPVTEIKSKAFYDDDTVVRVFIPDSITTVGASAFWSCGQLKTVKIGSGITKINSNAFQFCDNLAKVDYAANTAKWCGITFGNQYANPLYYGRNLYMDGELLTEISIPSTVKAVNTAAFYGCSASSVTLHSKLTTIGNMAFAGCENLTEISIPNSVTSLGDTAFRDCTALKKVSVGNGITKLGINVFLNCGQIEYTEYGNALYLGNSTNGNVMLIGAKNTEITSCTIAETCKLIASDAFRNCASLNEIVIPENITIVSEGAFRDCTALKRVEWNATKATSVTSTIAAAPFKGCSEIDEIVIGANVTAIPKLVFKDCGVKSFTLNGSATTIAGNALQNCAALTAINYNGTKSQWAALTKGTGWNSGTGGYTVECTDGKLDKDGNEIA